MSIKIGDKIRFLSSTGGGTVKSFRGKDQVIVTDEDGFEMPVSIKECIVVEERAAHVRAAQPASTVQTPATPQQKPVEHQPQVTITETAEGERLNLFIAYLPVDESKILESTNYEAYFVNDSNYFIFFNYMNRDNGSWVSRFNGLIEPNTKMFLEEFDREVLNQLERICVQFIAFKKNKPYALKNSYSIELHVDTVKFYKQHCFMENDYFDDDALLLPLVKQDIPERELLVSATELQESMQQKVRIDRSAPQQIHKKKTSINDIIEVDLHIAQILDTTAGMNSTDMLNYQLKVFRDTLQEHANEKGRKIVFIHGKGEGVLRRAIENELKTRYKDYIFQDASFQQYGFGATMITIR